jgi:hypothetical protein
MGGGYYYDKMSTSFNKVVIIFVMHLLNKMHICQLQKQASPDIVTIMSSKIFQCISHLYPPAFVGELHEHMLVPNRPVCFLPHQVFLTNRAQILCCYSDIRKHYFPQCSPELFNSIPFPQETSLFRNHPVNYSIQFVSAPTKRKN